MSSSTGVHDLSHIEFEVNLLTRMHTKRFEYRRYLMIGIVLNIIRLMVRIIAQYILQRKISQDYNDF